MKFDYHKVPSDQPGQTWHILPAIPVFLTAKGRSVKVLALIDSGADRSLFHSSVAEKLGLDTNIATSHTFAGIEGKPLTASLHNIELQIAGSSDRINLEAGFINSDGVGALLGQADFFQHYKIAFERAKERIEITPAKK